MKFNPKLETLAFRVWQFCQPIGWNATATEIANATGVTYQAIGGILKYKGWSNRIRTTRNESPPLPAMPFVIGFDEHTLNNG